MGICDRIRPLVLLLAGLIGASGVALAAAATHMGGALLGPASAMCLAHAPAMLALYAGHKLIRPATGAGLLMGIGTVLFAGDLALKQFYGTSLFPMAAPTGGVLMMIGWLVAALGAFVPLKAS
ncbi:MULTISPECIES: DUF423 domain-containing protein [Alphaproteobacteria]|uniref:Membrane protein n=2 Tax=Alphaproteobacteria TaxID=28211 RepID=A0A512HJE0_9HYPH|nr:MULTISPECIES: DUF423 domain-containing protein [Alphaproteobacteria]GEO85566.1 membrane protein [Ciceribacter naphthalenivorans]GLR22079.1 membrane protein [Ciceribacter naphthalenivorans]GLT04935.1 membrane protein [Sphingomonas psychrolutea]